jgi:hypothetical protein
MGADLSRVRVHADRHANRLNRTLNANAFTTGRHVFFRDGAYAPGTRPGRELLLHELTHVMQQTPQDGPRICVVPGHQPEESVENRQAGGEQAMSITPVADPMIQRNIRWKGQGRSHWWHLFDFLGFIYASGFGEQLEKKAVDPFEFYQQFEAEFPDEFPDFDSMLQTLTSFEPPPIGGDDALYVEDDDDSEQFGSAPGAEATTSSTATTTTIPATSAGSTTIATTPSDDRTIYSYPFDEPDSPGRTAGADKTSTTTATASTASTTMTAITPFDERTIYSSPFDEPDSPGRTAGADKTSTTTATTTTAGATATGAASAGGKLPAQPHWKPAVRSGSSVPAPSSGGQGASSGSATAMTPPFALLPSSQSLVAAPGIPGSMAGADTTSTTPTTASTTGMTATGAASAGGKLRAQPQWKSAVRSGSSVPAPTSGAMGASSGSATALTSPFTLLPSFQSPVGATTTMGATASGAGSASGKLPALRSWKSAAPAGSSVPAPTVIPTTPTIAPATPTGPGTGSSSSSRQGVPPSSKTTSLMARASYAKARLKFSLRIKKASQAENVFFEWLKMGRLFMEADVDAIRDLSGDKEGEDWLNRAGIGTLEAAENYLAMGYYLDWLKLPLGRRLLIATIAWIRGIGKDEESPPPPYTLGQQLAMRSGTLSGEQQEEAEESRDAAIRGAFANMLMSDPERQTSDREWNHQIEHNSAANAIVTKIFFILQVGLQVYDKQQSVHIDYEEGDVARALAHGGRVNIRIPALGEGVNKNPYALTDWLGITSAGQLPKEGPVKMRHFGTHHIDVGANKQGHLGKFEETSGTFQANISNLLKGVKVMGTNLAAGGMGSQDFNGSVILPDGSHGHMFIGFLPPSQKMDGYLQIGIETIEPGAPSPVGYHHGPLSTEKTANPESSFYGHKGDKIGSGKLKTNQRYVDLRRVGATYGRSWLRVLMEIERNWQVVLAALGEQAAYEGLVGRGKWDKIMPAKKS